MKHENIRRTTKKAIAMASIAPAFALAGALACYFVIRGTLASDVRLFLDSAHAAERGFIEKLPLYEDYADPMLEQKLRTHLNPAHLDAAARFGIGPLSHESEIRDLIAAGRLERVDARPELLFYYYNVRDAYRALTPAARLGLIAITERFQRNIRSRADLPRVKIAVSSMLRPGSYQRELMDTNVNAAVATTHSSGISFDIFFDDYFVVLPQPDASGPIAAAVLAPVRTRLGFLMGDALRGQFRTVLTETLIQLQDEGVLYAILEKRQRCYHVTILGNGRP